MSHTTLNLEPNPSFTLEELQEIPEPLMGYLLFSGTEVTISEPREFFLLLLEYYDEITTGEYFIEPGYEVEHSENRPTDIPPILLWDWHDLPRVLYKILAAADISLEWYDEWLVTPEGGVLRTVGDMYDWQSSWIYHPYGDPIHIEDHIEDWISACEFEWNDSPESPVLPARLRPENYRSHLLPSLQRGDIESLAYDEVWTKTSDLLEGLGWEKLSNISYILETSDEVIKRVVEERPEVKEMQLIIRQDGVQWAELWGRLL